MRLAWATDIHLNFVSEAEIHAFGRALSRGDAEAAILTGDLSEAPDLVAHLEALSGSFGRPIYFVLGNHDYYRSSVAQVRARMKVFSAANPKIRWLSDAEPISLSSTTALVGHDGWADGRCGDYAKSPVLLNDYVLIEELSDLPADVRLARMRAFAAEAVDHLRTVVPRALETHTAVVVATHIPPFREACWHEGRISNDDWLPHFTCKVVGDALVEIMRERPDKKMLVLCGHTHGAGVAHPLPNLEVRTGGADYCEPEVQTVLEL